MPVMDASPRPQPPTPPSHGRSHDQGVRGERHAREPGTAAAVQSHTLATFGLSQSGLRETLHQPARPDATDRDDAAGTATPTPHPAPRTALPRDPRDVEALQSLAALSALAAAQQQLSPSQQQSSIPSEDASQASTATAVSDSVFTPPASQTDATRRPLENGDSSSQESQLLQLSQLAATRDKMDDAEATVPSRKRMADGEVKDTNMSPVRGGHSRNTSTVSVASTTTSTIGEVSGRVGGAVPGLMSRSTDACPQLSSDLKTRLSYAMVKLNHGWQSHSIDEVESMASQAVSPTSTNSTLPGRTASSASPRMAMNGRAGPPTATTASSNPSPATYESFWRDNAHTTRRGHNSASPPSSAPNGLSLAPPVTIQPARPLANPRNPRRNSNPHYTPTLLSHSQSASPQTPAQSSYRGPPRLSIGASGRNVDPVLFSPHQNVREQDAAESLLFMSSPGNSGNMKHGYVPVTSSSQPLPGRHALPTSQPRKGLPTSKPTPKRVGFEMSPSSVSDMDIDTSPQVRTPRGVVRRRINGGGFAAPYSPGHRGHLSLPTGLGGGHTRARPPLADEEIERMLDRVVQGDNDSSDDEEIQIPTRREGAGIVG